MLRSVVGKVDSVDGDVSKAERSAMRSASLESMVPRRDMRQLQMAQKQKQG